jgi:hypothetical protein
MIRKPYRERDTAAAISGVDQRLRECLQVLWLALPKDKQSSEELDAQFNRLVVRALRDFKEDLALFPPEEK